MLPTKVWLIQRRTNSASEAFEDSIWTPSTQAQLADVPGFQLQRIGENVSEMLDYTPGVFAVEQHVRGK